MRTALLTFFTFLSLLAGAQPAMTGKWKSVDDNSGEARSIVEIAERNGKIYGRVVKIFTKPGQDPDPICDKCDKDDPRFDQKVIGMEIILDMVRNDDTWSGGTILDPETGKVYSCKLWIEKNTLKVRGYVGPFFRTQTWFRAP